MNVRLPATFSNAHTVAALVMLGLTGCATESPRERVVAPPPPPDTNVYFYPTAARPAPSEDQQNRDKFECNSWAVRQSSFDPSLPNVAPHQRVQVIAGGPPPGTGVAVGAVTGAVIGGAVSGPWNAGRSVLLGAVAGAAIGGLTDAERASQTEQLQTRADADANAAQTATLEKGATNYRRAMAACLEGRGYTVR